MTDIDDAQTRERIRQLIADIPLHAEQLLQVVVRDADSTLDPDWPAQVARMQAEIPALAARLARRAEQYLEGRASTFDTMVAHLEPAWHHIEDVQETLTACQGELQDWSEEPVSGICLEYLRDLKQASELQRSWLEEMGRALEGYRDLLAEARHRALLVLEAADHALQYKGVPGRGASMSWSEFAQVVGIVMSAISFTPIPAAGAQAMKVISFLMQIGSAVVPAPTAGGKHVELEGSGSLANPVPTLTDALDRLTDLGRSVHEAETVTFTEGFGRDADEVAARGGLYRDPWSVAVRNAVPAVPAGSVAVNIARLYRVGVEMLPAAAYAYQRAAAEIDALESLEGSAFGYGHSAYDAVIGYSRSEFEQFRSAIYDCFQSTRNDLLDVGDRFEQIAQNHRMADTNSAAVLTTMNQYVADIDASYTTVDEAEQAQRPRPTVDDRIGGSFF